MDKKLATLNSTQVIKISNIQYNRKIKDYNKVDINVLLNRVKLQKIEIKKRNTIFVICTLVGLSLSAYLIFN